MEHALQFEVVFYTNIVFLDALFSVIATTYGPISMKLCMAVKGHRTHVFANLRKVSSFFFY